MKKYLRFFYLALFAVTVASLTACGDDDDEFSPSSGGNGQYTFKANGKTYYYSFFYYGTPFIGNFSKFGDDYYFLQVEAWERQPTSYEEWHLARRGELCDQVELNIEINNLDLKSAKKGDELSHAALFDSNGYDVKNYFDYSGDGTRYYLRKTSEGTIRFVSYQNDILTVSLENVTMYARSQKGNDPSQFVLNGNISFAYED